MSTIVYDLIVVGGGPVGLATAYEAAKADLSVMVLEQNNFFNQAGSSGDLARMYRTMYTEDFMADMAHDSLDIWTELEKKAGTSLRSMTGLLNFGDATMGEHTAEGTLLGPIANLCRLKMPYRELTAQQIEAEWPFKNLPKGEKGYKGVFAPDNGVINVQLLLRTLSRLAKTYGAHAEQHIQVTELLNVEENNESVWTVKGMQLGQNEVNFKARKVAITAGAYVNDLLEKSFDLKLDLNIWEMTASYWNINSGPNGPVFPSMWFQFAPDKKTVDPEDEKRIIQRSQLMYGFPALEWGPPDVVRIAVDAATRQIDDPKKRESNVINAADIQDVQEWIRDHVVGVDSTVPASSLTCLQTNVFDNMFVLDFIPEEYLRGGKEKSVMIFTAGWAMKFVPLLGRALMEMATVGESKFKRPEFSITREGKDENKGKTIIAKPKYGVESVSCFSMEGQARGSSIPYRPIEIPLEA